MSNNKEPIATMDDSVFSSAAVIQQLNDNDFLVMVCVTIQSYHQWFSLGRGRASKILDSEEAKPLGWTIGTLFTHRYNESFMPESICRELDLFSSLPYQQRMELLKKFVRQF